MYGYLTAAVKRRVLAELKKCFTDFYPQHKDILPHINHKYSFTERPQKGIVVTGVGATPQRLSSDNFQGIVYSYAMKADVDGHTGFSVEWIREDDLRVRANQGQFPSLPGIYYVTVYAKDVLEAESDAFFQPDYPDFATVKSSVGEFPFYFFVDELLDARKEPLTVVNQTAFVMNAPFLAKSLRVEQDGKFNLQSGYRLRLEATESVKVIGSNTRQDLGLKPAQGTCVVETAQEPFQITSGINDTLTLEVNETLIPVILRDGLVSAEEVAADIRNACQGLISPLDFTVLALDGKVSLTAVKSLQIDSLTSTANSTLGLPTGSVPAILEGLIFTPQVEKDFILSLEVNGTEYAVPFYTGTYTEQSLAQRLEAKVPGLTVTLEEAGDYAFDKDSGEIRFLRDFDPNATFTATYKYPGLSRGPYGAKKDYAHNDAIPGVVMAFGRRIQHGDKLAVVVYPDRVSAADEYGGRFQMNVDLDIITRDPIVREELSDGIMMYFHAIRKASLADEGLEITDVSFGGEAEDVYDSNAEDYFFNASISLTIHADWSIEVPRPLMIETVTPTSYEEDQRVAGTQNLPTSDGFVLLDPDEAMQQGKGIVKISRQALIR